MTFADDQVRHFAKQTLSENCEPFEFDTVPLIPPAPDAREFPVVAMGALEDAVRAIASKTQAPIAIAGTAVLSVAALATQGHIDVETLGPSPTATSIFALTIAKSGERKSAVDKLAMDPVRKYEQKLSEDFKQENDDYIHAKTVWTAKRNAIERAFQKSKDGKSFESDESEWKLDDQLLELGPEPEPPLLPMITASDPTMEGLIGNFDVLRPSLGIFSDEAGMMIGGFGMQTQNLAKTVGVLSSFWDGSPTNRTRASGPPATYAGRRVSTHLQVQPAIGLPFLANEIVRGQGIAGRILFTHPTSNIGTRLYQADRDFSKEKQALDKYERDIMAAFERPMPIKESFRNQLEPFIVSLSNEARALFIDYYNETEIEQAAGGRYEAISTAASKSTEQAIRISAVLAFIENNDVESVSETHAKLGIELAKYYLQEALRLDQMAPVAEEYQAAQDIWDWLNKSWTERFVSVADIQNGGPNHLRRKNDLIKKAVVVLANHHFVALHPEPITIRNKKREQAYQVRQN